MVGRKSLNVPILIQSKSLESGYYRLEKSDTPGFMTVRSVEPTKMWEDGYDEGYDDGFEAGIQFQSLRESAT